MVHTKYFSILKRTMSITKWALLSLTVAGAILFTLTQLFLIPFTVETTSTECEVDPVTQMEINCVTITVPTNDDDTKAFFLKTFVTLTGYVTAFSFFTYAAFKFDRILQQLKERNVFTTESATNLAKIAITLVVVPLIYTLVSTALTTYAFSVETMDPYLHAVQRGLEGVPLMQFNVSTLLFGFMLLLTIELIKQGEHYKQDSDLSI